MNNSLGTESDVRSQQLGNYSRFRKWNIDLMQVLNSAQRNPVKQRLDVEEEGMARGKQAFWGRPTLNLLDQSYYTGEVLKSLSNRLHNFVVPLENWEDLSLHLQKEQSQRPLFVSYSVRASPRATGGNLRHWLISRNKTQNIRMF